MFSLSDGKGALSFALHASAGSSKAADRRPRNLEKSAQPDHICRSTSIFLISAMALAGLRPFGASAGSSKAADRRPRNLEKSAQPDHICRSTSIFLISAMALAGLRPFGQALAQFRMVWQR